MNERNILANGDVFNTRALGEVVIVLGSMHPDTQSHPDELVNWASLVEVLARRCLSV